jgi:DNA-binding PadR family transcriptional regulator
VSPVFRHGGLRLYLLKLLDEAPRHGYEVIRLLQDRFLGVYSPSPGTIYPRLARLEEEGLVTHDEVDGRKVYRITDKGREEIQSRLDDLADLEEELTESVRDIAREVSEDVRDTVRNLREELTWAAARDVRREGRREGRLPAEDARERARRTRDEVRESARRARDEARQGTEHVHGTAADPSETSRPSRPARHEETRRSRQSRRDERQDQPAAGSPRDWADWASQSWPSWTGWRGRSGGPWGGPGAPGGPGGHSGRGWSGGPGLDAALFRDLERLAVDFARELRKAAWNTESIGENAVGNLRSILEDALARVKNEVFAPPSAKADAPAPDSEDQPKIEPERGDPGNS